MLDIWRIYGGKTPVETRVETPVKTPEQIIQILWQAQIEDVKSL